MTAVLAVRWMCMRCERAPKWVWFLWLGGAALAFGCGDDSASASPNGDGTPSAGGACPQAGFSETGCACESNKYGHRTCTEDLVWTACLCSDYEWACEEGDTVSCTCPGDGAKRETKCLFGGTFDCPCGGSGGTNDGGGTGGTPDPGGDGDGDAG